MREKYVHTHLIIKHFQLKQNTQNVRSVSFIIKHTMYIVYLKKQKYYFYSVLHMSSCRKLEIQTNSPKITQIK